jgi:hypothetical protein
LLPHPTFDTAYNTHTMGRMGITWLYTRQYTTNNIMSLCDRMI